MNVLESGLSRMVGLVATLLITSGPVAHAAERAVNASAVPAVVRAAVTKKYPGGRVVGYTLEEERGAITYELTVRAQGRVTDVSVTREGRIVVEEESITRQELPPAVVKALAASGDGRGQVRRIERIVEGENRDAPRFEIQVKDGRSFVELTFDRSGTLVKQERTPGR